MTKLSKYFSGLRVISTRISQLALRKDGFR
jgi:hypothetical protein